MKFNLQGKSIVFIMGRSLSFGQSSTVVCLVLMLSLTRFITEGPTTSLVSGWSRIRERFPPVSRESQGLVETSKTTSSPSSQELMM